MVSPRVESVPLQVFHVDGTAPLSADKPLQLLGVEQADPLQRDQVPAQTQKNERDTTQNTQRERGNNQYSSNHRIVCVCVCSPFSNPCRVGAPERNKWRLVCFELLHAVRDVRDAFFKRRSMEGGCGSSLEPAPPAFNVRFLSAPCCAPRCAFRHNQTLPGTTKASTSSSEQNNENKGRGFDTRPRQGGGGGRASSHLNPCKKALHGRAVWTLSLKCAMRWM